MSNTTLSFDTLQYAKKLIEAGVSEQQAEIQAEALRELIDDKLATKQDIQMLRQDMMQLEERMTYKLTIRLGSMIVAGIVVLGVLFKF
jgi:cell shape-determining protein MreC